MNEPVLQNDDFTFETASDLPWQIDRNHLKENGKLLSDSEIQALKKQNLPEGYHPKGPPKARKFAYPILHVSEPHEKYYAFYKKIGSGAQGDAFIAQDLDSEEFIVIKEVFVENSKQEKRLQKEIAYLGAMKQLKNYFSAGKKHFLVMDLAKGITLDKLGTKSLSPFILDQISLEILNAVKKCHNANILHRDIKPNNILVFINVGEDGNPRVSVKLIDFGASKSKTKTNLNKSPVGTGSFLAPEVYPDAEKKAFTYTEATDIFAAMKTLAYQYGLLEPFGPRLSLVESIENASKQAKLKHFKDALADNPDARPSLGQNIDFFTKASTQHLHTLNKMKNVAVVYAQELEDNFDAFVPALRAFDYVQLIVDNAKTQPHQLIGKLQEEGVFVSNTLLKPKKTENNILHIASLFKNKNSQSLNNYVLVSKNTDKVTDCAHIKVEGKKDESHYQARVKYLMDSLLITAPEFGIIKDDLNKEKTNLQDRLASTKNFEKQKLEYRINFIEKTIEALQTKFDGKILTKNIVLDDLKNLETKMYHTTPLKYYASQFLGLKHNTRGAKAIAEISKQIKPGTASAA